MHTFTALLLAFVALPALAAPVYSPTVAEQALADSPAAKVYTDTTGLWACEVHGVVFDEASDMDGPRTGTMIVHRHPASARVGIEVKLIDEKSGEVFAAMTDDRGHYAIASIPMPANIDSRRLREHVAVRGASSPVARCEFPTTGHVAVGDIQTNAL